MKTKKTFQAKEKDIKRDWHLVDVKSKILGRVASKIAQLLIGKGKVIYTNNLDMGDNVVVINAKKIVVSGRKAKQKSYKSHSGYPGGFKEVAYQKLLDEQPEKIIKYAVSGMLPANRLKKNRMARLFVYSGKNHPYAKKFESDKKDKK